MNAHRAPDNDREIHPEFWKYVDGICLYADGLSPGQEGFVEKLDLLADELWESHLETYDDQLKAIPQATAFYRDFAPLHDAQIRGELEETSPILTYYFTVGVKEARIECERFCAESVLPRWLCDSSSGPEEYLYDEFWMENGKLTFAFYGTSGICRTFYGVKSIGS